MSDNHTLCRQAGIAYIPPAETFREVRRAATPYRIRRIGRQGWIAAGLGAASAAIGVVIALAPHVAEWLRG
jgi:hypothetical protein